MVAFGFGCLLAMNGTVIKDPNENYAMPLSCVYRWFTAQPNANQPTQQRLYDHAAKGFNSRHSVPRPNALKDHARRRSPANKNRQIVRIRMVLISSGFDN